MGLVVFGVAFLALFLIVAISEGVGDPDIPEGNVALVEGVSGDKGEVSEAEFERALEQAAARSSEKKVPKPSDPKYEELKETALKTIFESIWVQGLAAEMGIEVSDKEIDAEREKLKKESFESEAEYQKFLKEAKYTPADVDEQVRLRKVSAALQEQLKENAGAPSQREVEDYYEAAKDTQFTQPASRDIRVVVNKDGKKAEDAKEALSGDNTAKNWSKVAKKYSEDPTTKGKGGLQKGVREGVVEEPLNAAIFSTPEGQVEGPIKGQRGYAVFEVVSSSPEAVQELKAVEQQIKSTLAQRAEQEYFTGYVATFNADWTSRTFCASDYVIASCANFESDGRPASAPPACYEEDPDGGLPEACPAPVFQLVPALPGSISPLEPRGKPLAQRPQPVGGASTGATGATGVPGGAVPPPAEAPSE